MRAVHALNLSLLFLQVLCDVSIFDGDEMKWTSSIATQFFFCAHSAVLMPISITTPPHLGAYLHYSK